METQTNITTAKKRGNFINISFLVITTFFWGLSFISTKVLLNELPPSTIALFRQFIALIPLTIAMMVTKSFVKITKKDFFIFTFSGLFGIVLYFVFENTGIKYTTASNASIIVAAVPVFTLISEILIFKMKPNAKVVACIILSILGVYLVISVNGKLDFSSQTLYGNLLVIASMISWVIYTIVNKKLENSHPPLVMVFYQTLSACFLFIPFVLGDVRKWHVPSTSALFHLIYLGVLCSAVAYILYINASQKLGPAIASTFLNLIPVVSVIAGYLFLDETLTVNQFAGMIIIISSLFVIGSGTEGQSS